MKNLVQKGDVLGVTAPYDLTSGVLFVVGALIGVAQNDALSGASAQMVNGGQVFNDLAKATGETWADGDVLYWDATNKRLTKTSSGTTKAAIARSVEISGATTGTAKLLPNL